MSKKIKNTQTAEQRRAQAEQLQASIADQVDQLRNSEQWIRFLQFARSFHPYSINNLILIMAQCPTATRVAGFRQWQAKGRQVRKGERSFKIFGFAQKKIRADDDQEAAEGKDEAGERVVTYYPVLSVFDISQTDPIDPDNDPTTLAEQRLSADDPDGIADAVTEYLTGEGWTVELKRIEGADGYTDPQTRRVVIDTSISPADTAATLLHEAAHVNPARRRGRRRVPPAPWNQGDRSRVRRLRRRRPARPRHHPQQHPLRHKLEPWRHRNHQGHRYPSPPSRSDPG